MSTRSEHTAHLHLDPATLESMRNLTALQRMRDAGWTVGKTFTHKGKGHKAQSVKPQGFAARLLSLFA